ncbi:DEAD/DEAH box helicase [Bifidobacterium goeldii]|nr:DEAD/DEAH box helicase [Bifidobacterium goeldii]
MYECLDLFSEPTRAWFKHAFGSPTEAQQGAWPAIHSGGNVLVIAPTGSGKTLSAFLSAIDRLMGEHAARSAPEHIADAHDNPGDDAVVMPANESDAVSNGKSGRRARPRRKHAMAKGVKVLYVSPLKALAVDVAKNLQAPLEGIAAECRDMGLQAPNVTVATRSGDTTPQERRAIVSHPPDILVTTPESLYLLLTSKARRILATVNTVIVDEVHAVAGTKRGAHLALSLERLDALLDKPAQRIGLSATVNPPQEAARFLAGARPVSIINPGSHPAMDLRVVEPLENMRDLQSANAGNRAGGISSGSSAPRISGITPAMQRLAERRGIIPVTDRNSMEGELDSKTAGGIGSDSQIGHDSVDLVGAAGDQTSGSIWPVVERSVLDEILAHHTTLVFVNSRGLAEKLTARFNDMYADMRGTGQHITSPEGREGFAEHYDAVVGSTTMLVQSHEPDDVIAMAHHGSVSKDRRKQIEEKLKRGALRCVVATSSLELGIDMGSVDLVIQIAPPLSVSSGLQRVGRADHRVGGVSHALFYPLTREQIIGVAASIESMKAGAIEPLSVPRNPLDVLAQQTVAAAAMGDIKPDEWYATVRRAAPFAELSRDMFDAVMGMLTGAYADEEFTAFRPPLMWNHDDNVIAARPGAQRLAVTSGGTIPDRGLYTVVLPEADAGKGPRRVGELDEEMVYESRVGDVITLGTSTWQIQEITRDRVIVTPAPGRTARLPFWHGEGAGRDYGFGCALGRFLREAAQGLQTNDVNRNRHDDANDYRREAGPRFDVDTRSRLKDDGLDDNAIDNLARLLGEQRAATTVVPDDRHLVIERCPDEEGDWRVIIHSPYGRRVHEPWAMAIDARLKQRYGFDGQTYAADDGIVFRLPQGEGTIPIKQLITFDIEELQHIIETQVGQTVLFAARFRECAARSLYLPRTEPGKRVPLWQQRLRAAQLLNAARMKHNFPLLLETARECLQDVYDLPALRAVMSAIDNGSVTLIDTTTQTPSPFAENLLFGFVGTVMYQYDVPQAERSAQLLSMDPQVLEKLLGDTDMSTVLDPEVIAEVTRQMEDRTFWNELDADDIVGRVSRYAKTHGPFTADQLIADTGIPTVEAVHALDELKQRGDLINGIFTRDDHDDHADVTGKTRTEPVQWLHREVFRRIRALSLSKARKAIKPVSPQTYQAFLLERQGIGPIGGEHYEGIDGLMRVLEQLEGVALSPAVWERSVLPTRVRDYQPAMLDELLAAGDIVWVGSKSAGTKAGEPGRIAFHPADSALLWTGEDTHGGNGDDNSTADDTVVTIPDAIMRSLASSGAYRADQLAAMTRRLWQDSNPETVDPVTGEITTPPWSNTQFEEALWSLVWQGKVTNSSFAPLRALGTPARPVRAPARSTRRRIRMTPPTPMTLGGLWSSVAACTSVASQTTVDSGTAFDSDMTVDPATPERRAIELAEALLDRYGVIAQPLVEREDVNGGYSGLYPVLRRMEEHGLLTRGMFVRGFGAAQFAARDTVDMLRDADPQRGASYVTLDVNDPANLYGSAIEWPAITAASHAQADKQLEQSSKEMVPPDQSLAGKPSSKTTKPSRRAGGYVVLHQGELVLFATPKSHHLLAFHTSNTQLRAACAELAFALPRHIPSSVSFIDLNGIPLNRLAEESHILHAAGFTPSPQGMKLCR